jgi:hypothetical protein
VPPAGIVFPVGFGSSKFSVFVSCESIVISIKEIGLTV